MNYFFFLSGDTSLTCVSPHLSVRLFLSLAVVSRTEQECRQFQQLVMQHPNLNSPFLSLPPPDTKKIV